MIEGEPAAIPVTTPVEGITVARLVLFEVQVPPVKASDKEIVNPGHTDEGPVTGAVARTVTFIVT